MDQQHTRDRPITEDSTKRARCHKLFHEYKYYKIYIYKVTNIDQIIANILCESTD